MEQLSRIVAQMRAGGFYDRVMDAGAELDRVKAYLAACAGVVTRPAAEPLQHPKYPCFPGLRHRPWHDPAAFPATGLLEARAGEILEEALALDESDRLDYSRAAGPARDPALPAGAPPPGAPKGTWTVYLFDHMGLSVEPAMGRCPRTRAVLESLPGACRDYPWGDALFSAMGPGAHLRPHCSIDNLRIRIHLGLTIPEGCTIRVGREERTWREGHCLVFEDSFEHEVWNRSSRRRVVLIADLWHPDLTPVEIRALTAGFRKSEVRRIIMGDRLGMTDAPGDYLAYIESRLAAQDETALIREFWTA